MSLFPRPNIAQKAINANRLLVALVLTKVVPFDKMHQTVCKVSGPLLFGKIALKGHRDIPGAGC